MVKTERKHGEKVQSLDGEVREGCTVSKVSTSEQRPEGLKKPHGYLGNVPDQADSMCKGPEAGIYRVCLEMWSRRWTRKVGRPDMKGL